MTDIKTSIDPSGQPDKEWLKVQKIEKLQADKQTEEEVAKKNPAALLMAGFCAYVRKTALFLASRPLERQKNAMARGIEHELSELKKSLHILTQEDRSHNSDYVFHLSQVWHTLLEKVNLVEFLERRKSDVLIQLKNLITALQTYPPKQEFSLGFYMMESAGKSWLPLPLMQLLHHLYDDFQEKKQESALAKWISTIDSILTAISKKPS